MTSDLLQEITVVGAGQMGRGIAQLCAAKGLRVKLYDSDPAAIKTAPQKIYASSQKLQKIWSDTEIAKSTEIEYLTDLKNNNNCQIIIEAIIENESAKLKFWREIDPLLPENCIRASNTSAISISKLASTSNKPENFIGMHFMNPVPKMALIEIIPGLATNDKVYQQIVKLSTHLGKEVVTSRDMPGFIVNRLLMPMINEAFWALNENLAKPEDIDQAMRLGTNQAMGPLALADLIGLDTCAAIIKVLSKHGNRFQLAPLLQQYVDAGYLGRKSGRGVFIYPPRKEQKK